MCTGKARVDNMIEKGAQRGPVAVDVDEQDRLVVQPKLLPADDLQHLVESSDPARQYRKAIRLLGHQPLALVHAADDDQFGHAAMSHLGIAKMRRDNAGHFSFGGERGVRQQAHQPDPRPAIDELDSRPSQLRPELARGIPVFRLDRTGGAAVDA